VTAIQRWFFIDDSPYQSDEDDAEFITRHHKEEWCKAKDVAELEKLLTAYIGTIKELRSANVALAMESHNKSIEIEHLKQHVESMDDDVNNLTLDSAYAKACGC
jgi:hypothetical protein